MATLEVAIDASRARQGGREAEQAIDRVTGSTKRLAAGVAATVAGFVSFQAAVSSVRRLASEMLELSSAAEETKSAFGFIFGQEAVQQERRVQRLAEATGRYANDIRNFQVQLAGILKPQGFEAEEVARIADALSQIGVDLGSFFNTADAAAFQKIVSGIVGQSEPLLAFGVDLRKTRVDAEAARLGFEELDGEFSQQAQTLARLSLIYNESIDKIGDAERTSDSYANTMRRLDSELKQVKEELGGELKQTILESIEDYGGLESVVQDVSIAFEGAATAAKTFLSALDEIAQVATGPIELLQAFERFIELRRLSTNPGVDLPASILTQKVELPSGNIAEFTQEQLASRQFLELSQALRAAFEAANDPEASANTRRLRQQGLADVERVLIDRFRAQFQSQPAVDTKNAAESAAESANATKEIAETIQSLVAETGGGGKGGKTTFTTAKAAKEEQESITNEELRAAAAAAAFGDSLFDVIQGFASVEDAALGFAQRFQRILLEQAFEPIEEILKGKFLALFSGVASATGSANGNAFFGGRVIPFAAGGVIGGPTLFPLAGGLGLAGEAGAEAILPLERGKGGKLGVIASGGGGPMVGSVVFNVQGGSGIGRREMRRAARQLEQELVDAKRRSAL